MKLNNKRLLATLCLPLIFVSCTCKNKDTQVAIQGDNLMRHVKVLSSDAFEGRAPASRGEQMTIDYMTSEFKKLKVKPLFDNSFLQPVKLATIETKPANLRVTGYQFDNSYQYGPEVMLWTRRIQGSITLPPNDLVFVGYGINAPEYNWNDYANINVAGKTVLILINDPGFVTKNPAKFKGSAMTYYGRWTYKFEEAARQGAAAAIIIHNTAPASYPWEVVESSWSGKQFHLAGAQPITPVMVEGWLHYDAASELLAQSGLNLAQQEQIAAQAQYRAKLLPLKVSTKLQNTIDYSTSNNIGAKIVGTEKPDELVLYVAHWDHLGIKPVLAGEEEADNIYNGAMDNATGTGALIELARVFKNGQPPKRSIGFLAVTAEESGLIGSAEYTNNPLEDLFAEVAKTQNRTLTPEDTPEKGYFYRSDHFNFAKKGVPALYAEGGTTHRDKGSDYITKLKETYIANHYHKPSDEINDDWNVQGMVEDVQLYHLLGDKLAQNTKLWPQWYDGNEFKKIREASLRGR